MRSFLAFLFTAALLFTACGGGEPAPSQTPPETATPPPAEPSGTVEESFESGDTGELEMVIEENFESGEMGELEKVEEEGGETINRD